MGKGEGKGAQIQYDSGNMLKIICKLKGSVVKTVWPQMLINAGLAVVATMLRASMAEDYFVTNVTGHSMLGTALAFLVVFRSNLSYGRYWDGRGQLGLIVKSGRELMRHVVCYTRLPMDENEYQKLEQTLKDIQRLIVCNFHASILAIQHMDVDGDGHFDPPYSIDEELVDKGYLRGDEKAYIEKAEGVGRQTPDNKGRPSLISALLAHKVYYLYHRGWMNAAVLKKCDSNISDVIGAWMTCEKIVGTPMVFPYTQMLSIFMCLFVYTIPFPLAHVFFNPDSELNGFIITPFISALVAFAFFGMNAVGIEIENPFGDDINDLAIHGMLARVELDTLSLLDLKSASDQMAERDEAIAAQEEQRYAAQSSGQVAQVQYAGGR
jgi:putative membrane protein